MDIYVAVRDSLHTVISYKHIMLLVIILLLTYLAAQLPPPPKKKTYYSLNDIKQTCPLCGMLGLMRSFSTQRVKLIFVLGLKQIIMNRLERERMEKDVVFLWWCLALRGQVCVNI